MRLWPPESPLLIRRRKPRQLEPRGREFAAGSGRPQWRRQSSWSTELLRAYEATILLG